jgi:hypothetical protein
MKGGFVGRASEGFGVTFWEDHLIVGALFLLPIQLSFFGALL